MGSPYVIAYRGVFSFPLSPDEMWDVMEHTERFESWWGWLHQFRLEGDGLAAGSVLRGLVSPPVPYRMRVNVVIEEAARAVAVDAAVHGDLEGWARLRLSAEDSGTRAEVTWAVEMMQRPMRVAARLAHPLLQWGHDRVVEITVEGFKRHLATR